jgi:hypothetical protein
MFPNNHPQDLRYRKIIEPNTSSSAYTEVRAGQLPRQATAPHTPVGRLLPVLSLRSSNVTVGVCAPVSFDESSLSLSIARAFGPVAEQRLPVLCEETVTKTGGGRATGPFCALDGRGSTATHLFSVSFPCPRIPLDGTSVLAPRAHGSSELATALPREREKPERDPRPLPGLRSARVIGGGTTPALSSRFSVRRAGRLAGAGGACASRRRSGHP